MRRTRHSTSLTALVFALSLAGVLPLGAQAGGWQPAGLEGESIRAILALVPGAADVVPLP